MPLWNVYFPRNLMPDPSDPSDIHNVFRSMKKGVVLYWPGRKWIKHSISMIHPSVCEHFRKPNNIVDPPKCSNTQERGSFIAWAVLERSPPYLRCSRANCRLMTLWKFIWLNERTVGEIKLLQCWSNYPYHMSFVSQLSFCWINHKSSY